MAKMNNAPVFYTIAQISFNPILKMEQAIPQIQDEMRRIGFPGFKAQKLQQLEVQLIPDQQPTLKPSGEVTRWHFLNAEETSGYLLFNSAVVFHTTAYEVFANFKQQLLVGLKLVSDTVGGLAYVEKTGIRYLDAILPQQDASLDQYLNINIGNLPKLKNGALQQCFVETILDKQGGGQLISRALTSTGSIPFPPDLLPFELKLSERFSTINGMHVVLDTDRFIESRRPFDEEKISVMLDEFHDDLDSAFKEMITERAHKEWM